MAFSASLLQWMSVRDNVMLSEDSATVQQDFRNKNGEFKDRVDALLEQAQ